MATTNPRQQLLKAVLNPDLSRFISKACDAGANPNEICPEISTSYGHIRGGSTLLILAINEGFTRTVQHLLENGADANLTDDNGWKPWAASLLTDEYERNAIQKLLLEYGSEKSDEHLAELARAISDGDLPRSKKALKTKQDLNILSNFRVDFVGQQIALNNMPMLAFLLENKMPANSTNLINAIRTNNTEAVTLLLGSGIPTETDSNNETPLMTACSMGNLDIAKVLIQAGANPNRYAHKNEEWTPLAYAKKSKNNELVDYLFQCMSHTKKEELISIESKRDPKYKKLFEQATASEELSTIDIVKKLTTWDDLFGIKIDHVGLNNMTINLISLPRDVESFYEEILEFCPDLGEDKETVMDTLLNKQRLYFWWD